MLKQSAERNLMIRLGRGIYLLTIVLFASHYNKSFLYIKIFLTSLEIKTKSFEMPEEIVTSKVPAIEN